MDTYSRLVKWIFLLLFFSLFASSCVSTVRDVDFSKVTSQKQLSKEEQKLWRVSDYELNTLRHSGLIYRDSVLGDYVEEVGQKLVPAELHKSIIPFSFNVIYDPQLNAFALPNGTIFVHLGLLARLENEAQLAQVLAHEITHVLRRHGAHRYSKTNNTSGVTQVLSVALSIGFGASGSNMAGFWNGLAQSGLALSAVASINGYSREAEREADIFALDAMHANNYDLAEAPDVFEILLSEYDDPSATETFFYGDHPRLKERINYLQREVVRRDTLERQKQKKEEIYAAKTLLVRRKLPALWLEYGDYENALKDARTIIARGEDCPEVQWAVGNAYMELYGESSDSLQVAEKAFFKALDFDSTYALAWRGLGDLNDRQYMPERAKHCYKNYLALAPKAMDRRFIETKIKDLEDFIEGVNSKED